MKLSHSSNARPKTQPSKRRIFLGTAITATCLLLALLVRAQTFPDASVYASDPAAMLSGYRTPSSNLPDSASI